MEYILVFFLLTIVVTFVYLVYFIIKLILATKTRRITTLSILGFLLITIFIHKLFFEKMEFIQSEVYPNLYLIKHPIKNRDSIDKIIKIMVIEFIDKQDLSENNAIKIPNRNTIETINENDKTIHFYKYTSEWGFNNGTVHFIEHKEDAGGFSSEVLNNYPEEKLAYFKLDTCSDDSSKFYGELSYFKDGILVKKESIINQCK